VLRTAFADLLPPRLRRRAKVGFGVPLAVWLRGPLYRHAHDLLLGRDARSAEYLRPQAVAALLEENRLGMADHGKRIWALLNLEAWLRRYGPADAGGRTAALTPRIRTSAEIHEPAHAHTGAGAGDISSIEGS
jgi:hypothetical protein